MALSNLFGWKKSETEAGSACGAACGAADKPAEKPAACGTACHFFFDDARERTGIRRIDAEIANQYRLLQSLVKNPVNVLDRFG